MTDSPRQPPGNWPQSYRLPGETVYAGEYPGDLDPERARARLAHLLDEGVRTFIDLTQEVDGLAPYAPILAQLAAERGDSVQHLPLPIPDMSVPDVPHMARILDAIDAVTAGGDGVYVHCWGGIGRTGTTIACLLMRRGLDAEAALAEVQRLYGLMPKSQGTHRRSPQTREQFAFVRGWQEPDAEDAHAAVPLRRLSIDAAELLERHPPQFEHPHKVALVARLLQGPPVAGRLHLSQWRLGSMPAVLPAAVPEVELREGFYRYDPADTRADEMPWHVNFADAQLFGFYFGALLAQDELQVLEHPLLGAVREWAVAIEGPQTTISPDTGEPTPILVSGVERRGWFRTTVPGPDGTSIPLYGNAFGRAPRETVERALQPIVPPTVSHIIAIAAKSYGQGNYSLDDISWTLRMAVVGFAAAAREARQRQGDAARAVIHTGWWGCGAFGNNRELMAILQLLAAQLAGVRRVVFHRGFDDQADVASRALARWQDLSRAGASPEAIVHSLFAAGYRWGVPNGT